MRKYLVISGRVQGVGFRYWLQSIANKKNIFGWVKNKITGEVEALIIIKWAILGISLTWKAGHDVTD